MSKRHLDNVVDGDTTGGDDAEQALRKAYKKARNAYKKNKSDETLKRKKLDAKKAWEEKVNITTTSSSVNTATSPPTTSKNNESSTRHTDNKKDRSPTNASSDQNNKKSSSLSLLHTLEQEYQLALATFKADKSNKDKRRAKTAARRALDDAIAAKEEGGERLICRDCSKMFIFKRNEMSHDEQKESTNDPDSHHVPKRCVSCNDAMKKRRLQNRTKRDNGTNMCRSFQRGNCQYGELCKFSHNPLFAGTPPSSETTNSTNKQNDHEQEEQEQEQEEQEQEQEQ